MNPNREELLFQLALTKPAVERSAWLDRECGEDGALRARLDALLAAHEAPDTVLSPRRDDFHESPSSSQGLTELSPPMDEAAGHTLGRYKLIERLGEGGFGEVAGPNAPLFHSASTFKVEALAVRRPARFSVVV